MGGPTRPPGVLTLFHAQVSDGRSGFTAGFFNVVDAARDRAALRAVEQGGFLGDQSLLIRFQTSSVEEHGSSPIGGATDFLPTMIGTERAMASCVLCEPFSAHKAYYMGVLTDIAPALKVDGKFIANPLVETKQMTDEFGRLVFGDFKTGDAAKQAKALMARGTVDLSVLDAKVEELCAKMLLTFPDCTTKTLEELRKPKLIAWNANKENSRAWLALNMMTEARAGFVAFNEGTKEDREVDFIGLRQRSRAARAGATRCTTRSSRRTSTRADAVAAELPLNVAPLNVGPLKVWVERDGALLRLRLARPKANIVDAAMIAALRGAFDAHRDNTGHRASAVRTTARAGPPRRTVHPSRPRCSMPRGPHFR